MIIREIKLIQGSMNSGKTHKLAEIIKSKLETKDNEVFVYDFLNIRNSDRDLRTIFGANADPNLFFMNEYNIIQTKYDSNLAFVFDEVHFIDVFGKEREFATLLVSLFNLFSLFYNNSREISLYFSGLVYDCYNRYAVFPIWSYLERYSPLSAFNKEIEILLSRVPCNYCKSIIDVKYSMPDRAVFKNEDRVGNHYVNLCGACLNKFFPERFKP